MSLLSSFFSFHLSHFVLELSGYFHLFKVCNWFENVGYLVLLFLFCSVATMSAYRSSFFIYICDSPLESALPVGWLMLLLLASLA
jgi:hypothetical protein